MSKGKHLTAEQRALFTELLKLTAPIAATDGVAKVGFYGLINAVVDKAKGKGFDFDFGAMVDTIDLDLAKGQAAIARAREILVLLKNNAD